MSNRSHRYTRLVASVGAMLLLSSCAASVRAPIALHPEAEHLNSHPFGAWLYLEANYGNLKWIVEGEFIAIDSSSVIVMRRLGIERVHMDSIAFASLDLHTRGGGPYLAWTLLGVASTVSHGYWLVLSAPIWLVTGLATTFNVKEAGYHSEYEPTAIWWSELRTYARLPMGLPPGVAAESITPHPVNAEPPRLP